MKRAQLTQKSVIRSHRDQWRALVDKVEWVRDALELNEPDAIKALKVYAETLKIIHEGERRAWGIDDDTLRPAMRPTLDLRCGEDSVPLPETDSGLGPATQCDDAQSGLATDPAREPS